MSALSLPHFYFFLFLLFLLTSSFFTATVFSIDPQIQALLKWKNTLDDPNPLHSWNPTDLTPCNWFGIQCDSNSQVTKLILKSINLNSASLPSTFQPLTSLNTLILSSTNLTGNIPPQFSQYTNLTLLDLTHNSITGSIPFQICTLPNLQTLLLNTNSLQGNIPSDIGNMSTLKTLTLHDNQLTGQIPTTIGKLTNLETFRAGGNKNLNGQLPIEIGNCTNLIMLGLAETSISGSLPKSIGNLKKIQTISIYATMLSGSIPEEIGNCTELTDLNLYKNLISGSIPISIGRLRKLQSILLWKNSIVGAIPDEIGGCKELTDVDFSENFLTGNIPTIFGSLSKLEALQLSRNQLTGIIPHEICNCLGMTYLEVDKNNISGEIPYEIGKLKRLFLFYAWHNKLTGKIPDSISQCENLQFLDISDNNLSGSIPKGIFSLQNLTHVMIEENDFSGSLPPDIGNCANLYRFRINLNRLSGPIPLEIGNLKNLNFLDMGDNRFSGEIPDSLFGCENLELLDLHSNSLSGSLPTSFPKRLQVIYISDNRLSGVVNHNIGLLSELSKLNLENNQLSGRIPSEIVNCNKLQLLNLGNNRFSGDIPKELGQLPSLEISLNLCGNQLTGPIPGEFSGLTKLGILDLSRNNLNGNLDVLTHLENLVSLNVSFNDFSGELPKTSFFMNLPMTDLAGNRDLKISNGFVAPTDRAWSVTKLAITILSSLSVVLVLLGIYMLVRTRVTDETRENNDSWELTLYQKMELSIEYVLRNMTSDNVIGTGGSGVVYRVMVPNGETLAVKKVWLDEPVGVFESEIRALGSIRHRNIVRLLGWASNSSTKLLFYDYQPNGTLSSLLHGGGKVGGDEWESRLEIILGVAHALAYLHYDCVPSIIHGDVKAMNVLLGHRFEPYLADFGLARTVNDGLFIPNQKPQLAGSYGYMAPEHASMQRITEKSDVYSFGVVLLEVLTGRHPLDPTLPGGVHLVQWVRDYLQSKQDPINILDQKLRGRAETQMHEMLQTLAASFLCLSTRAQDRPTMKDIVAMLTEIRHEKSPEADLLKKKKKIDGSLSAPPPPTRKMVFNVGSSNCSFSFSDESS
ncbi:LRR receptor-like serine/threonine-protein kinase RGI3 [Impatiens glandulifera]|uniref:LRR receptor-like serine/threonine-protein kinase RGI3 n=1 Tax=Impatiens glandulifera TaxID=253017 RepID=UPI001FB129F2|nr:LRR receptor-like serine/threonine-protein kinase RGI3 [Impatiens glandulifera]